MSIGIQAPDHDMLHKLETMKQINKKQYTSKMIQTDDLGDEVLYSQLKAYKERNSV